MHINSDKCQKRFNSVTYLIILIFVENISTKKKHIENILHVKSS